jgi:hypothetical protein
MADLVLTTSEKTAIDTKITDIEKVQSTYVSKNIKYQQIKETALDDMKYEVYELVSPKGEIGYISIFRKIVDKKEYVKTVGYGLDSKLHTHDWALNELDLI